MNKFIFKLTILFAFAFCTSCHDNITGQGSLEESDWLVPVNEIRDGGPGKDGIPALENPTMISVGDATYLSNNDLVIGYVFQGDARAYPHSILNWHEIVNDNVANQQIAITYCPLTGTGIGWSQKFSGGTTTYGVSGLLYNSNLMPYDRTTNSTWTQQGLLCLEGELQSQKPATFQVFETTWKTWKTMYPNTTVVSTNTGHSRNYDSYPYGNYLTNSSLFFSVSKNDERLFAKERVHSVIIDGKVKVYRFSSFKNQPIILDSFEGENIVVIGSESQNFIISFKEKNINGQVLMLTLSEDVSSGPKFRSPIILEDQFGNVWDIFGQAISGPNEGEQMQSTQSFMGFWFSYASFYEVVEIYEE